MNYSVSFSTITAAVAALSVSGVTIKDTDAIPVSELAAGHILMPRPDKFVENFDGSPDTINHDILTYTYTLNYVYYHCQIGSMLDFSNYPSLMMNIVAIVAALLQANVRSATYNTKKPKVSNVGQITDPVGNEYLGCWISIPVEEFLE